MSKTTINTTAITKPAETLEQGIERIREVFRSAPSKTIRIVSVGGDRSANSIEGGVNGYMFSLQRGVTIESVPQPILEVLDHAGIEYSIIG